MIEMLEQLSLAVGVIDQKDAKQVAEAVNRVVQDLVSAQVVKLYWRCDAEEGVILEPITFINRTQMSDPKPFAVSSESKGILPWAFRQAEPLWLEDLHSRDLSKPVRNHAAETDVDPEHLDMRGTELDSMMVVPLTVRGSVCGLYSVELTTSGRLKLPVLEFLQRVCRSLGTLFWDAELAKYSLDKTSRAVAQFLNANAGFTLAPSLLQEQTRAGFIARPFASEFSALEDRLAVLLQSRGVQARSFLPQTGHNFMIDEIMSQIRRSHFCLADVTGSNPNVMAEVGMMMILNKHFLLLKRKGDAAPRPFDLSNYPMHEYQLPDGNADIQVWNAAANRYESLNEVLDRFIANLPADSGFQFASEWHG